MSESETMKETFLTSLGWGKEDMVMLMDDADLSSLTWDWDGVGEKHHREVVLDCLGLWLDAWLLDGLATMHNTSLQIGWYF